MRTQRRRIRIRPSRQNNIADKLLAPRPIRPRNNRRLRHAVMPHQRCLDLPRLNPEAANLNLMVRAPHKLQNPIPAPARQVPAAVHPPSRSPIPIRNKALTRQPATTNISPPNPSPRYVKLPNHPNRHRLQAIIQNVDSVVGQRTTDRDARNLEMAQNLLLKRDREGLTSQHQVVQRSVVRGTVNDRFQVGRYANHKSYVIPHQLMPELSRRFPYHITDDDCCPAPDEGQQRLLDRGIKSARNDKRGSEATPHVKVSS